MEVDSRLNLLDTLEVVLRTYDSQDGKLPQELLAQLVEQTQAVLELGVQQPGNSVQGANPDAGLLESAVQQLQEQLEFERQAAHEARQAESLLSIRCKDLELEIQNLQGQLVKKPKSNQVQDANDTGAAAGQPTNGNIAGHQYEQLQQRNNQLEAEILHAKPNAASEQEKFEIELSELRGKVASLQQELDHERKLRAAAEDTAKKTSEKLAAFISDAAAAQAAVAQAHTALEQERQQVQDLRQELHFTKQQLEDAQKQLQESDLQIQEARRQLLANARLTSFLRSPGRKASRAVTDSNQDQPAVTLGNTNSNANQPLAVGILQAEVDGLRHSNRILTQRLIEFETLAGKAPIPGPTASEYAIALADIEGLQHTCKQLREQAQAAEHRRTTAEENCRILASERATLEKQVAVAEQQIRDMQNQLEINATAAMDMHASAQDAQQAATRVATSSAAEVRSLASGHQELVSELLDARKRLATSSAALENEVKEWQTATSKAVDKAEEAQARAQILDVQLAEVSTKLRAAQLEVEALGLQLSEARLQQEDLRELLDKKCTYIDKCELAVIRPLLQWYSQHGYPTLVALKDTETSTLQTTSTSKQFVNVNGWPHPIPVDVSNAIKGSDMEAIRSRAGKLLGKAAVQVDSLADKRLEVAAAAFELLAQRINDLQQHGKHTAEFAHAAAEAAADQLTRMGEELRGAHQMELKELKHIIEVERLAAEDARTRNAALQKELSSAVNEACTATDRASQLDRQLAALQAEVQRMKKERDVERAEAHDQQQAECQAFSMELQLAVEQAHADGITNGKAMVQPQLDIVNQQLQAAVAELEQQTHQVEVLQQRIQDMQQAHKQELQNMQLQASQQQAQQVAALCEASEAIRVKEKEWEAMETALKEEHCKQLKQQQEAAETSLRQEQGRCETLLAEEQRLGLTRLEEAISQWEQQHDALHQTFEQQMADKLATARQELAQQLQESIEQEWQHREEDIKQLHATELQELQSRHDMSSLQWRQQEDNHVQQLLLLKTELQQCQQQVRCLHNAVDELQTEKTHLAQQRDDALASVEPRLLHYQQRLSALQETQEALHVQCQAKAKECEASLTRLQAQLSASMRERDALLEERNQLKGAYIQQCAAAAAMKEASEAAWVALQEAQAEAAAKEALMFETHEQKVQDLQKQLAGLQKQHSVQLAATAAQIAAMKSRQQALMGVVSHQSEFLHAHKTYSPKY